MTSGAPSIQDHDKAVHPSLPSDPPPETGEYGHGAGVPGLVSVVVPTYNRAYIVGQAVESALGQTHRSVEVIVVDDGSTDSTPDVIARYDSRVRYLRQSNGGVIAARNTGLRAACGEFIALLDSDDSWLPWKLEAQLRVMRSHPGVGMVWTDMAAVDGQGAVLHSAYLRSFYAAAFSQIVWDDTFAERVELRRYWESAPRELLERPVYIGDIFSSLFLGNFVHTSTVLLRRDRLREVGGFDSQMRVSGEDYDFHMRTARAGPVAFLDAPCIKYRIDGSADQLTAPHLVVHIARSNLATVRKHLVESHARLRLDPRRVDARVAEAEAWCGEEELKWGDRSEARRCLLRSLRPSVHISRRLSLLLLALLPPGALPLAKRLHHACR